MAYCIWQSIAGSAAPPLIHSPNLYYRHDICHPGHFLTVGDHIGVFKTVSLMSFPVIYTVPAKKNSGYNI